MTKATQSILVTVPCDEAHRQTLAAAAPGAEIRYLDAGALTEADLAGVDILFGNVRPALLSAAKDLKLLQLFSAGTDGYLAALPEGCLLANATGAFGLAISEHLLAMLLTLMKRLHQYRDNQSLRAWRERGNVSSLEGASVVVLGLGDIGGEFARKCKALGAYVIGVRRTDAVKPDFVDELVLTNALDSVLPRAEVLAMALPGTGDTARILDARRIALLPEGAIVLNVGRGSAIDQDALADAIETRGLRAGLDVTDPEPLPPEHRLWALENCLITPHISGYFYLKKTLERMVMIAAENIARFNAKRTLINLVDPQTGYRRDKYDGGKDVIR